MRMKQKPPLPTAKATTLPQCACPGPGRNVLRKVHSFFKMVPYESHHLGSVFVLWLALPQLHFLPPSSQDSNKTSFSAAAQCFLLRNLKTGEMVLDSISQYIDDTFIEFNLSVSWNSHFKGIRNAKISKPETSFELHVCSSFFHRIWGGGGAVAVDQAPCWAPRGQRHLKHHFGPPGAHGSVKERDGSTVNSNSTQRPCSLHRDPEKSWRAIGKTWGLGRLEGWIGVGQPEREKTHFSPTRMAKNIKDWRYRMLVRMWRKWNSHCWRECKMAPPLRRIVFLMKLNTRLCCNPAILHLGVHAREIQTRVKTNKQLVRGRSQQPCS